MNDIYLACRRGTIEWSRADIRWVQWVTTFLIKPVVQGFLALAVAKKRKISRLEDFRRLGLTGSTDTAPSGQNRVTFVLLVRIGQRGCRHVLVQFERTFKFHQSDVKGTHGSGF